MTRPKWQDIVFSLASLVFIGGLVPSVLGDMKPEPATSLPTALALCLMLTVNYSYRLWYSLVLTAGTAGLWFVLFFQAI